MPSQRIAVIAPVHQFDDIRIFHKEAKTAKMAGFAVTIIALGKGCFECDGIRIIGLKRTSSRLFRFLRIPFIAAIALKTNADLYHLHNPDTIPIALLLKACGKRVIYDSHEDFKLRIMIRNWIPTLFRPPVASLVAQAERIVGLFCDGAIATQERVKERMGSRCILLPNAPIISGELFERAVAFSKNLEPGPGFRLIYAGAISENRGIFQLLEAIYQLNEKKPNCRLWLLGKVEDALLEQIKSHKGFKHTDYLGLKPQFETFGYMMRATVGLVPILDVGDHKNTSPNKLYEYIACGIPFVASDFNAWVSSMPGVKAGLFVNPIDTDALQAAIRNLIENGDIRQEMVKNGQSYLSSHFNWEKYAPLLNQLYAKTLQLPESPCETQ